MTDTVYDATVVAFANGELDGRREGNALDLRLHYIEDCLAGRRAALYNARLEMEYETKVREYRNDIVEGFIEALELRGKRAPKSTLSRTDYQKRGEAQWPSHDQHLLAAALFGGEQSVILVTEKRLATCSAAIKRHFGVRVVRT